MLTKKIVHLIDHSEELLMELRILKVEKGASFGKLLLKQMAKPFPPSSDQVYPLLIF